MRGSVGPRLTTPEVVVKIRPRRQIDGISAVLLSFKEDGSVDFDGFAENILRTSAAGLTPAINVEFGYVERLTLRQRRQILDLAGDVLVTRPFVAGATIHGQTGNAVDLYREAVSEIVQDGGTPIIIQSEALNTLSTSALVNAFETLGADTQNLLASESDPQVLPGGKLFTEDTVRELMAIPKLTGLRHSSFSRRLEWERLTLRDYVRPDFRIYSGNDIGVDMMMYGSDYFLSVSAVAPEAFALRDRYWKDGDSRFYELNDVLQSLGMLTFRPPFGAARHSAMC